MTGRPSAVWRQLCPSCREGRVFEGLVRMHETCPTCGVRFEREDGYFLGAMYFSYFMGLAVIAGPIGWLIMERAHPLVVIGAAAALLIAVAPFVFRLSRVVWMHFDDHFDPFDGSQSTD